MTVTFFVTVEYYYRWQVSVVSLKCIQSLREYITAKPHWPPKQLVRGKGLEEWGSGGREGVGREGGREGGSGEGREGGREGREGGREWRGREGGMGIGREGRSGEGGREWGREGGSGEGREGVGKGGREWGREGGSGEGREGEDNLHVIIMCFTVKLYLKMR